MSWAQSMPMKTNRCPLESLLAEELQRVKDETRAQLTGLDVQDTDFGEWLKSGGEDRRKTPRDPSVPEYLGPRFL